MQRHQRPGDESISKTATQGADDFESILSTSIAEGMMRVLGPGGAQAIFFHLDMSKFDDPARFHEKLTTIFGVGTGSLERVILQHLHQTMGIQPAFQKDDGFVAQVERAKKHFDRAKLDRRH